MKFLIAKDFALREFEKVTDKLNPPKLRQVYGQAIGVLVVDNPFPRIPGDIANATTYPFPVRFKVVEKIYVKDIVCEKPDQSVCKRYIEEAQALEKEGIRAITTSCGYLSYFQDEIAEALNIPVFTSSLIQVPMVSKMLGKNSRIGIICANGQVLTKTHLQKSGIDDSTPVAVVGLDKYWSMVRGQDPEKRQNGWDRALSTVGKQMVSQNPDLGAFVLECTNFPPGSAALQEATGLPVFDIVTLIYMIHEVVVRKRYSGHM